MDLGVVRIQVDGAPELREIMRHPESVCDAYPQSFDGQKERRKP